MENTKTANFSLPPNDGRPYLGDVAVVDGIVRSFLSDVADKAEKGDSDGIVAALDDMANIFGGQNPAYAGIDGWHTVTELGQYAAMHLGIDGEQSLHDILRSAFGMAAQRMLEAIQRLATDGDEESGQFEVDVIAEETMAAMTGTWEICYPENDA